jgi:competence protein ComEA
VAGSGTAASGGLVNVNTASAEELETLPGIGEVTAQAIIDHRTENGPFTSVDQLLDVTGIGDVTLENIRDLVTV